MMGPRQVAQGALFYEFSIEDLTTFKTDMAQLTGVEYGGVAPLLPVD